MSLPALVREARVAKDESQETLAREIGVSKGMIQHIESGRREPSLTLLRELARHFGWKLPWDGTPGGSADSMWFIQTLEDLLNQVRMKVAA